MLVNIDDLYRLLRADHIQSQGIVDTVTDPMLVLDESLRIQAASRSSYQTFKVDRYATVGQRIYELGNDQWDIPELRVLLMQVIPKSTAVINYEVEHEFPDLGRRTMLVTARKLHHPDNASHSMLLAIVDVTEAHRREAAKDILLGELRHRMKNLLTVAQSLARQTSTEGRSAEEYRDAFLGRFGALIQAQDLAFAEQKETDLATVIERLLAPYSVAPDAVVIEPGPAVDMGPRAVMSFSLVLHELATNAVKYGALSARGGSVRISWTLSGGNRVHLRWVESGGPPVTAPSTTGYGTELIRSALTYTLSGQVEQEYAASGLRTEFVIPVGTASHPS